MILASEGFFQATRHLLLYWQLTYVKENTSRTPAVLNWFLAMCVSDVFDNACPSYPKTNKQQKTHKANHGDYVNLSVDE